MIPRLQASSDYVHERDQTLKELINPLVVTGVENELLDEEMDPKGDLPKEFPLAPTIVCKEKGMRGSQLEGLSLKEENEHRFVSFLWDCSQSRH